MNVDDKGPRISLSDTAGNMRTMMMVDDKIGPWISLSDAAGETRTIMSVDDKGPRISLSDAAGQVRAEIGKGSTVEKDGMQIIHPESSLRLFDRDGGLKWSAP